MATQNQIVSMLTHLTKEVHALRIQLDAITAGLDLQPAQDRIVTDPTKGTFLPGTGWTDHGSDRTLDVDTDERGAPVVRMPS